MNKCEHGEKITIFCASDCCVWKEAAGCDFCMKKYHNHMGPTIFLTEEQIVSLVKKYTMDSSIKPKCRLLQEAIYSYFNLIKNQITSSIDIVCKNIINQIGYPFLYANNNLSTYKRLKNKEYKKLIQKQFKNLYEVSQKINEKELLKEEAKIYMEEMKNTEELLNGLQQTVKKYYTIIQSSYPTFAHDSSYIFKINQILKNLNLQSKNSKSRDLKDKSLVKPQKTPTLVKQKQQSIFKFDKTPNSVKQKEEQKLKPLQLKKTISDDMPSPSPTRTPIISPTTPRPNYSRDVSIDRKMVKEHRFGNAGQKPSKQKQKQSSLTQVKSPNTEKIELLKQELNNKESEINDKKRMLIDMMKNKEESLKKQREQQKKYEESKFKLTVEVPSLFKKDLSQKSVSKEPLYVEKQEQARTKLNTLTDEIQQTSELQFYENSLKNDESHEQSDIRNHAFTQLPVVENELKKSQDIQEVKEKVFFIPKTKDIEQISNNIYAEINSPIFKNFNKSTVYNKPKQQMTQVEKDIQDKQSEFVKLKTAVFSKHNEVLQLKQNEQKSLALLLKSLTLNAQQAIKYLQSALSQAQNNLSAAEYLTYLYLQLNKPQNCLHLCNKMLQKLQNSTEFEQKSLIINNNKAAALNILGRYSESIMILQKCLRYRQKDYLYKNLGDAYYSISIYEKAIYNYEKTLRINECYDEAQYNLAVCLFIQQNYYNAKLAIKKALQMQPQNDNYLQLLQNIQTKINHC